MLDPQVNFALSNEIILTLERRHPKWREEIEREKQRTLFRQAVTWTLTSFLSKDPGTQIKQRIQSFGEYGISFAKARGQLEKIDRKTLNSYFLNAVLARAVSPDLGESSLTKKQLRRKQRREEHAKRIAQVKRARAFEQKDKEKWARLHRDKS